MTRPAHNNAPPPAVGGTVPLAAPGARVAAADASAMDTAVTVVRASHGWRALDVRELWRYRELLYFLTWRDVKVRYKQTAFGVAWAVMQPVFSMVVFSLFFGRLARVPSDGVPYPVFSLTGLVPWTFFATGLTQAATSLVGSQNLITKVYFPRLVIPAAAVLAGLVDLAIAFVVLVALAVGYGVGPRWTVLWVPALVLLALVAALGVGLWLAALNVQYRDVRYVLPFLTQLWLFATPVVYPSTLLGEPWRTVYALNPMVGVVEGFRWAVLGSGRAPGALLAASSAAAVAVLVSGAFYFRRVERGFADVV